MENIFFILLCNDLNLKPKAWFKVTAHLLSKGTLGVLCMSQIGPRGEYLSSRQGFFIKFCYGLHIWPRHMVQGHCTPITKRHSVGDVWARMGYRERRCAQNKRSWTDKLITTGCLQSGTLKIELWLIASVHFIVKLSPEIKFHMIWGHWQLI